MKVINIILDPRLGGPQWRIAEVAKRLKEDGIETIVVFPEKDSNKFKKLLDEYGVKYKTLNLNKLSKNPVELVKWFITFIPQTVKLVKLFKKINPDIVHCNASWQWKGVIAAKFTRKKVVWHLNDTKIPFFIRIFFKYLIKKIDGIIVEGKRVKDYYLKSFKLNKPIIEIQAPVDTEKFDPEKVSEATILSNYDGIRILSVGNVNPYKGFEYFIEAANVLNKEYDNLWFFVAGGMFKSQKAYINKLNEKLMKYGMRNFMFLGSVDNIPSILKSSDIYVCSSVTEASPQSVWEAMAMGKPIVSTDVGSVPDFIKNGENGFIVPVKSPAKLAEKIELLIKNESLREKFSKKVRKIAIEKLDIKICAKRHKEFYEKIKKI